MTRFRRALFIAVAGSAMFGFSPARAVNEPVLVTSSPKAAGFAKPAAVTTVTATFDRDIAAPPATTFDLKDSSGNAVPGAVSLQSARTLAFSPAALLEEGVYTASVIARAAVAGDPKTSAFSFTIDGTPPSAPVVTYPPNGSLSNAASISVYGWAEPKSTVQVTDAGKVVATATAFGEQFGASVVLPGSENGVSHDLVFTATDRAGNRGVSSIHTIVYDNVAPAVPTMSVTVNGSTVALSGTADPGIRVDITRCIVNGVLDPANYGTVFADPDGKWTHMFTLEDGRHQLIATAWDDAGNHASTSSLAPVDTVAPAAPSITTPAAGARSAKPSTIIAGRAEPGATVQVFEGTGSIGTATVDGAGNWSLAAPLADGPHSIVATARDAIGNLSAQTTRSFIVEVDITPPSLQVQTEDRTVFFPDRIAQVTGTASDNKAIARVDIQIYDVTGKRIASRSAAIASPGARTTGWTTDLAIPPGVYQIRVAAIDTAGLASPVVTRTVMVAGP